jgi:hypothetical protein
VNLGHSVVGGGVNFLLGVSQSWIRAVLETMTARQIHHLEAHLRNVPFGILPITGFPGSGKAQLLVAVALLCLGSEDRNKLLCCAPNHAAATNFASRFNALCSEVRIAANTHTEAAKRICRPVVVRAFHDRAEVDAVMHMARYNGSKPDAGSKWHAMHWGWNLSFAQHFLKLMSQLDSELDPEEDSEQLLALQADTKKDPRYAEVRRFLDGRPLWEIMVPR